MTTSERPREPLHPLTRTEAEDVVAQILEGAPTTEKIHDNGNRQIFRWKDSGGRSLIAKALLRPELRFRLRRLIGKDALSHEWRGLERLHGAGVRVPQPLARIRPRSNGMGITDVLLMEDVGSCIRVFDHLKRMVVEENEEAIDLLEAQIVDLTASIVKAGVLDSDHSLRNIVRSEGGELWRLDLEVARIPRTAIQREKLLGLMLGRLLGSHCFVFQPETTRTRAFARSLDARLALSEAVRTQSQARLDEMLERQRARGGPQTVLPGVWTEDAARRG